MFIRDFMAEVYQCLSRRKVGSAAIPEQLPLLRTLQFAAQYWDVMGTDKSAAGTVRLASAG